MRAARWTLFVVLASVIAVWAAAEASAGNPGVISGRVLIGPSRTPLASQDVRLLRMSAGEPVVTGQARTDSKGRFRFGGLEHSERYAYLIALTYREVPYAEGPIRLTARDPADAVEVMVFEPTTDPRVIAVSYRIVMVQRALSGRLVVRDIMGLASRTPSAYVGKGAGTARVSLPAAASAIQVVRGMAPRELRQNALVDTLPVLPRPREVVLQYELPYRWSRATMDWPVDYPTSSFDLIVPTGLEVESASLTLRDVQDVQGERLRRFSAEHLRPGQRVAVTLRGLPPALRPYLIAIVGLVLTIGLVVVLASPFRPRRHVNRPCAPGHDCGRSG